MTITAHLVAEHLTGALALGLNVYALASSKDGRLRELSTLASVTMLAHNLFIGAMTAAALHTLFILRTRTSTWLLEAGAVRKRWACAGFVSATLAFGAATYTGGVSALLMAGSCCVTTAFFFSRGAVLRAVIGLNSLVWLVNAVVYDSAWQFASGVLGAGSAALGVWRTSRPLPAKG